MKQSRILLGFMFLLLAGTPAAAEYVLKMATLAPPGSTWMNIVDEWAGEVAERTDGKLTIRMYANGVAGDEPDVLRKIRYGQIQGGLFSGYGIGRIYSPARVLEMPFLFEGLGEIDFTRAALMPEIENGFRSRGFELLGWMEVGFVRFFSNKPIRTMDDLRKQRVWLWQGDPLASAFMNATGLSPVPLSIIDVYTSLSTGLIDTVYSTPLATIAMQWFTQTQYVTQVPMANAIGAIVVDQRFFRRLPGEYQDILRETAKKTGERLIAETRRDNDKSLDVLRQHGYEFMLSWDDIDPAELQDIRNRAVADLTASGYIPAPVLAKAQSLIAQYRARSNDAAANRTGTE